MLVFWKSHMYLEREDVAASSYTKNSISIFFRKIEFSEGGASKNECFWKSYIYCERGDVAASSCTKNSISIFFRNTDFSEGGPP
jgi:hypothetical protein